MDTIRINVANDRQVGLRFEEFPDELYDALRAEIDVLARELFARVEAATPSATGKLRSEERVRVFADKDRITGRVDIAGPGSELARAGALEYGAHKRTKVSEHSRRLDHAWANMLDSPLTVIVAAYDRTPNISEVSFERGPLAEMQPEVRSRLNAVVEQAVARANG